MALEKHLIVSPVHLSAIQIGNSWRFTNLKNSVVPVVTGVTVEPQPVTLRVMAGIDSGCGRCLKENTQAGCQQCHAKDRVTQGADTLNLGRDLFSERGCMGCHRYEGFDRETDALANTRQTTGQLQDQITANEKQIREEPSNRRAKTLMKMK